MSLKFHHREPKLAPQLRGGCAEIERKETCTQLRQGKS